VDTSSKPLFLAKVYPKLLVVGSHMCHQRPERSFFFGFRKYPVCARCTGVYLTAPLGVASVLLPIPPLVYGVLAAPLVIDGVTQLVTKYESTNSRRFITGALFGVAYGGVAALIVSFALKTIRGS
jgi:uncharacterized membrane protein